MTKEDLQIKFAMYGAAQRCRFGKVSGTGYPTVELDLAAATLFADRYRAGRIALIRHWGWWGAAFGDPSPNGGPCDPAVIAHSETLYDALARMLALRLTFPGAVEGPSATPAGNEPREDARILDLFTEVDAMSVRPYEGKVTILRANGCWGAAFGCPTNYVYDARKLAGFTSLQAALNHLVDLQPRYPDAD